MPLSNCSLIVFSELWFSLQTQVLIVAMQETVYLTLIIQKAQRTYKRVLEGADVSVLWSYVVEETGEPGKTTDLGRATITLPHADTGIRSRVAAVASECVNHCAIMADRITATCTVNTVTMSVVIMDVLKHH